MGRAENHPKIRIDVLDGMRGIAVLLVAWYHFWQLSWVTNAISVGGFTFNFEFIPIMGFTGVELFFFISGFCLMLPYARAAKQGLPPPTAKEFFFRRAVKILPSFWLSLALMIPAFATYADSRFWSLLFKHLLFANNLDVGTMGSINGVLWSLAVEAQFYLVFPWVCRAFVSRPRAAFAVLTAIAWAFRLRVAHGPVIERDFMLSQLPSVLDLFASGMLASWVFVRHGRALASRRQAAWAGPLVAAGCVAAFLAILHGGYLRRFDLNDLALWKAYARFGMWAIFPLFTLGSLAAAPAFQRFVAARPLVFLSTISYNLYIWHQAIGRLLMKWRIPAPLTSDPHNDPSWSLPAFALMIVSAIGFAALVTYGLERPILAWGARFCERHFRRGRGLRAVRPGLTRSRPRGKAAA